MAQSTVGTDIRALVPHHAVRIKRPGGWMKETELRALEAIVAGEGLVDPARRRVYEWFIDRYGTELVARALYDTVVIERW